jgi:hypothetical protein
MIKVKMFTGKQDGILTNDFRKMVEEKLGKLNTPESFMYLFRRFGTPTYSNHDEYKILYDYRLQYEDISICVHASYHEHVYFDLFVPKHYFKEFFKVRELFFKRLMKESLNRHVAYSAFDVVYTRPKGITNRQNEKNWLLIDAAAQKYFNKEDYEYIDSLWGKETNDEKFHKMLWEFSTYLCHEFRKSLSKKDLKEFGHHWPLLTDVPEVRKTALKAIQEFKKGAYIRDVPINILGYESDTNKISYFIKP